ncbi:unnamed protein product [Amoebophrya sp. A25]|nr:unnamed protein product [Amoebophrya sp. A25]|eukprot:GSA25T00005081001.1
MLPLHMEDREMPQLGQSRNLREYLKMALHYAQLDIEYTFAQMFYILSHPRKVYQLTSYRKQTKNHWSRDDPAFVVLTLCFLFVASVAYSLAFHANLFRVLFYTIGVHYVLVGVIVATVYTYICNNYLRERGYSHPGSVGGHYVRQELEWQYAWDVHCNGFIHVLLTLYVVQFFLLPVLYDDQGLASLLDQARADAAAAISASGGATSLPSTASSNTSVEQAGGSSGSSGAAAGETRRNLLAEAEDENEVLLAEGEAEQAKMKGGTSSSQADKGVFLGGTQTRGGSSSSSSLSSRVTDLPGESARRANVVVRRSTDGNTVESIHDRVQPVNGYETNNDRGWFSLWMEEHLNWNSNSGDRAVASDVPRRRLQEVNDPAAGAQAQPNDSVPFATGDSGAGKVDGPPTAAQFLDKSKLRSPSLICCFLSNVLFGVSLLAYFYVTSMGYAMLPFLEKTEVLLYPCIFLTLMITLCIFLRINLTVYFVWLIC